MAKISTDFIVENIYPEIKVPHCNIWEYLEKTFLKYADKIALEDPLEEKQLTYKETHDMVETIASNLIKHGFDAEKPISIYMTNCLEYLLVTMAAWRLGGKVAVINPLLTPSEIKQQLSILNSTFVFCNKGTVSNAIKASLATTVEKIFCKEEHGGCITLSSLYEQATDVKLPELDINPKERTALIPFSSGTTGVPKGVELTHFGLIAETCYFLYWTDVAIGGDRSGLIYQPISHMFGMELSLVELCSGNRAIIMQKFELELYISLIAKYKVENLYFVPPLAVLFCKKKLSEKYDMTCVKNITIGAAPLTLYQENELREIMGSRTKIIQGWGMTELTCAAIMIPSFETEIQCTQGSVGWPLPGTKVKVVDLNTGAHLGPNQEGELYVMCAYQMKGYLGNPEATKNTFDTNGWLQTGDVGFYDEAGCFFVVDRVKELIKYKGYQVAPSELEGLLLTHQSIADAGVTSILDEEAGELPIAWVVMKPDKKNTEKEIQDFVAERVAPFKKLRGGVEFVDSIPKSPSGKILRRIIRDRVRGISG